MHGGGDGHGQRRRKRKMLCALINYNNNDAKHDNNMSDGRKGCAHWAVIPDNGSGRVGGGLAGSSDCY